MSHCSSWSERLGALGGTASVHLIPGSVACPERSQFARADSVSWLAPTSGTAASQDQFVRMRQRPVQWQPSNCRRPTPTSRFIDFFNSLADASITKMLLARLNASHTVAMSLEHQPPFPRMGLGTAPMLNNELLTPSDAEVKTQGDFSVRGCASDSNRLSHTQGSFRIRNSGEKRSTT
jgi:hypothetical protein